MFAKFFLNLLLVGCVAALTIPLAGCGGGNTPQGPELGALEEYLDEHPEVREEPDEEMDEIEGDEFDSAEAQ